MRRSLFNLPAAAALALAFAIPALPAAARGGTGSTSAAAYDVSYPQCGSRLPSGGGLGVVGVTDGLPWSTNPCLGAEYAWAAAKPQPAQLYMNTANPETASAYWATRAGSGPRVCANLNDASDTGCAYNYGWNSAQDALGRARSVTTAAATATWWLDVESANSWNGTAAANAQDLQGSLDYLAGAGATASGIYSTSYQWSSITGGYRVASAASWIAGAASATQAASWCGASHSFTGGPVRLTQYPSGGFDADYVC